MPENLLLEYLETNPPGLSSWHKRQHLLNTNDLTKEEVNCLIGLAAICKKIYQSNSGALPSLSHKTVALVFYENSTRTKGSFDLAAQKLKASVINLDTEKLSTAKGETLADTARTLVAMGVHVIVQRHQSSGASNQAADDLGESACVINAGDGWHAHPTQALLDVFSMIESRGHLEGSKVAIIGDIRHSRVAHSNIWLLKLFGVDIHVAGPPTLIPKELAEFGITVHNQIEPAIEQADFIITLRLQSERQKAGLIPSINEYVKLYRLDHHRLQLAKHEAKVLDPGPVIRNIQMTDELASDRQRCLVNTQVLNGVAVRMAVLYLLTALRD